MTGQPKWTSPTLGPLSAESTYERRATLSNDNEVVDGTAPPASRLDVDYHGKFFPRGCRGVMESISIYCIRTGAGTLTLRYAPYPGLGPIGEVIITPGSTWAWKSTAVEKMWNYDSLFIWVYTCSSDVSWAYDTVLPPDGHSSDDTGATWEDVDERPFIRAALTGETPGDVPVSGTVNTIKVLSSGAQVSAWSPLSVPTGTTTSVGYFHGAGTLIQAEILVIDDDLVVPTNLSRLAEGVIYRMLVYIDETLAFSVENRDLTQSSIATSGRSSCGEFLMELAPDSGKKWLKMNLRLPLEFKRSIDLRFYHLAGATLTTEAVICANVLE